MLSALHQARTVADICASFGVTLDDGKIERMADVLGRRRESWTTEAKRASMIRCKQRARRLARRRAQ